MHSVSIGICIKKATKSLFFFPLKGLRGCPNVLKCIIDTGAQRSCIGKKAFVRLGGDPDILSKSTHLYIFGDGKPWPSIGKTKIVSRDVPGLIRMDILDSKDKGRSIFKLQDNWQWTDLKYNYLGPRKSHLCLPDIIITISLKYRQTEMSHGSEQHNTLNVYQDICQS